MQVCRCIHRAFQYVGAYNVCFSRRSSQGRAIVFFCILRRCKLLGRYHDYLSSVRGVRQ